MFLDYSGCVWIQGNSEVYGISDTPENIGNFVKLKKIEFLPCSVVDIFCGSDWFLLLLETGHYWGSFYQWFPWDNPLGLEPGFENGLVHQRYPLQEIPSLQGIKIIDVRSKGMTFVNVNTGKICNTGKNYTTIDTFPSELIGCVTYDSNGHWKSGKITPPSIQIDSNSHGQLFNHHRQQHSLQNILLESSFDDNEKIIDNSSIAKECAICFENKPNCTLDPCGHLKLCLGCAEKVEVCPICRTIIFKRIKIYC
jgi:hypothetical protein